VISIPGAYQDRAGSLSRVQRTESLLSEATDPMSAFSALREPGDVFLYIGKASRTVRRRLSRCLHRRRGSPGRRCATTSASTPSNVGIHARQYQSSQRSRRRRWHHRGVPRHCDEPIEIAPRRGAHASCFFGFASCGTVNWLAGATPSAHASETHRPAPFRRSPVAARSPMACRAAGAPQLSPHPLERADPLSSSTGPCRVIASRSTSTSSTPRSGWPQGRPRDERLERGPTSMSIESTHARRAWVSPLRVVDIESYLRTVDFAISDVEWGAQSCRRVGRLARHETGACFPCSCHPR